MDTLECSNDILVGFAESLKVFPGLLAVAVVSGVFLGFVVVLLLYGHFLKPEIVTSKFQGCNPRSLFEISEEDKDDSCSNGASTGRRARRDQKKMEKPQPPASSDVAAFALKAKVVYPINQRYRPLADGASNPSLHENSKLMMMHHPESLSSSSLESLSQDNNDDDSSQFVSSSPVPKTFQNERFVRVSRFPETLCCTGFEGRIGLYCLGFQSFQQFCSELQEERHTSFLQILRIILNECFQKEKMDSAFSSNVLLMQHKELEELKKEASVKLLNAERNEDASSGCSTLEEMERAGRDRLEHGLQMVVGFSKQLERLCQHLQGRVGAPPTEGAGQMMCILICSLLLVERELAEVQNSQMKSIQEKLLWWEELAAWLQSRTALLRQEAVCRLRLVAKALEQLTSDGQLSFSHMEGLLSELKGMLRDELQQCNEECIGQLKELVRERGRKIDAKRRRQLKAQAKERNSILDTVVQYRDPQEFLKVYQALLVRQRKEITDLEEQQDWKLTEAVCDLWKRLHLSWSERLAARVWDLFQTAVPEQASLSRECCQHLRQETEQDLGAQLRQEESITRKHLEGIREQLEQDRQTWAKEEALVSASLAHLAEQQLKILRGMLVRQMDMQESIGTLVEEKQQLLLMAVQRLFAARHFSLRMLKEMRLSRLKHAHCDIGALELESSSQAHQMPRGGLKEPCSSEAEKRLGPESQLISQGFQQEFLSELDTGTEFLQEHAQLLVGHTFAQCVRRQHSTTKFHQQHSDHNKQQDLVEAVSESVYVTRDSINVLIHDYYAEIQSIIRTSRQDQQHILQHVSEGSDKQMGRNQLMWTLQKELTNWERKPISSEFQHRMESQKMKILNQYDLEFKAAYDKLRKKKSVINYVMNTLEGRLQEAEETFMSRLAAVAKVPPSSMGSN
ncbi:evC complex member EVC isoform X3 [Paramormyrops kingsleyae]|uniref:evC complex member EVC isoform X3 n=1 Tax=Paramormyrops kingsleyae TaxID=1676925 RepID=UPI003B96E48B